MNTDQGHLERRASQRFDFQLPVSVRLAGTECEGYGFTQDVSGRGIFFYTNFQVAEGDAVELTLVMPSEITLTENARVRCRGKVVRVLPVEKKYGVAARLEGYEYLPKAETAAEVSANFPRISSVQAAVEKPPLPSPTLPSSLLPGSGVPASRVPVAGVAVEAGDGGRLGNG